jgi:hypothetical protein
MKFIYKWILISKWLLIVSKSFSNWIKFLLKWWLRWGIFFIGIFFLHWIIISILGAWMIFIGRWFFFLIFLRTIISLNLKMNLWSQSWIFCLMFETLLFRYWIMRLDLQLFLLLWLDFTILLNWIVLILN